MLTDRLRLLFAALFLFFSGGSIASTDTLVNALLHHVGDPVAGNPNGSVTVVEFFDYECGHCVNMAPVISSIIKANPNVRIVLKEYPIRGAQSNFAARAALAANIQGKYMAFHHALMTTDQDLTDDNVYAIAKSVGLNLNKLKTDMNGSLVKKQLSYTNQLAAQLQINGTPAFFIANTNAISRNELDYVLGEMSQYDLQRAINEAHQ